MYYPTNDMMDGFWLLSSKRRKRINCIIIWSNLQELTANKGLSIKSSWAMQKILQKPLKEGAIWTTPDIALSWSSVPFMLFTIRQSGLML
jgi:hypothetical protein